MITKTETYQMGYSSTWGIGSKTHTEKYLVTKYYFLFIKVFTYKKLITSNI